MRLRVWMPSLLLIIVVCVLALTAWVVNEGQPEATTAAPLDSPAPVDWQDLKLTDVPEFARADQPSPRSSMEAGFITLCQYAEPLGPPRMEAPLNAPGNHAGLPVETYYGPELASIPSPAFSREGLVSPPRFPFSPEYRVRVGDVVQFLYQVSREESGTPYRLSVGDVISIESDSHNELRRENIEIIRDGTISLPPLQSVYVLGQTLPELKAYLEQQLEQAGLREPRITVIPVRTDLPNLDLRDVVDGRSGEGGQRLEVTVQWDGAVWLPMIKAVPIVGLTLTEAANEVNARYRTVVDGIDVTPVLRSPAPAFVYVLGEVATQGRVEIRRPTTPLQVITQAGGQLPGGNMHNVIILRRTPDWRLIATRIDLHDAAYGKGLPSCDLWLYDSDIVIVPRLPIERLAELINLYLTRGLYSIIPNQGISINFAEGSLL